MESKDVVMFRFNNIEIPFALDKGPNNIMINVTPIAKAYGKDIHEYLRLPSTKAYIDKLLNRGFYPNKEDIVISVRGRYNSGTWMNQVMLIDCSRWLDEEFAIWCNFTILNIIRERYLDVISERDNVIAQKDILITQLQSDNTQLQQQLTNQQPKILYFDQVLQNQEPLYSTNQIVKQLGIKVSNRQLLKMMERDGLIYKDRRDNQGYVMGSFNKNKYRISVTVKDPKTGNIVTVNRWTEAGKMWIHSLALGYKII